MAKPKSKPKSKPKPKAKAKAAPKKAVAAKTKPAKAAPAKPKAAAKAKPATKAAPRMSWLDAKSGEPLIHQYTARLNSFLEAMADGKIDASEVDHQSKRLVKVMKEIEPKLSNALHAEVTELLCELSAFNIMQTVHEIASAEPVTKFRG